MYVYAMHNANFFKLPPTVIIHLLLSVAFSALTLLVGRQEGPVKMGEQQRWALVSPDGVVPSRMVGVSSSVNLPLHHKVKKFSSGTGSLGWSQKKGRKTVVVVLSIIQINNRNLFSKKCMEPIGNSWTREGSRSQSLKEMANRLYIMFLQF